ncbi:MAG: CPBP family intramembrane glutamic endopeptidase [Cytophagales bacterium]|nr:CPBP family intramembrane metalloprotease [Bernardetiaceae bacterium]MDW8204122.1 CPBP family intramembrane glutamic endopeptidase [Cytophagales bacterium]
MLFEKENALPPKSALWTSLLLFIPVFAAGLFFFNFIGLLVTLPLFNWDIDQILFATAAPKGNDRIGLLIMQGVIAVGSFLLVPAWFMKQWDADKNLYKQTIAHICKPLPATVWLAAIGVVVLALPMIGWAVKWNEAWQFPALLAEFENWAKDKEAELKRLTLLLLDFQSPLELVLGLLVIAVIPGFCEEWLFRGFLQQRLQQLFGNKHVAVWVAAVLFSIFHLQFYGFVPRALLGAIFGYLFVFTGNLALPMLAHFFNNAYTMLLMYAYHQKWTDINIEDTPAVSPLMAISSALLVMGLLMWLRKYENNPVKQ